MPIYEFKCKNCGNVFEYLCLRSRDRDQACCPLCGCKDTETLLSTFSSVDSGNSLKGSSRVSSSSCSSPSGFS